ncbi:lig_chan-Glu_bd domain-containing protein [Trichonephila inaurata madagascariensis]|uniref:Lig_chan-Glu_bd domain-containing protein n=1 Tax=Trichonephila inaurata madagascariensis TaxID=2747483 RepID=A0A8X6JXN7_9ARAC|nr:lig_chan-Glu_bd domain-containing protein [Trichonephila inaurata madagascariensis]
MSCVVSDPSTRSFSVIRIGIPSSNIPFAMLREVDLILNPILPQAEFIEFLYYTNPITIEAYTILAGKKSEELGLFLYFSVLDKSVWLGIIIALLVTSVTSTALFRRLLSSSYRWFSTIGRYCWNYLSYMLKQVPKDRLMLRNHRHFVSIYLPLLNILWVFCIAFLVMNTFQSLLVSKLTLKKTTPVVDTLADLVDSRGVTCLAPREIQIDHVLKNSDLETNRLAWKKVNHDLPQTRVFQPDILKDVEKGTYCIIHGHLIIKDRLSTFFTKTGTCNMHLSQKYFYPFSLMMAIHKKMPRSFYDTFNMGVTRLVDADITGKWFEAALKVSNLCTSYSDNALQPLGIQHIYGVLVLWAAGLTMSFIVLLFERNLFKYKNNNTDIRVNKI